MRDSLSILERCVQDGENEISEDKIKQLVGIPEIEITSGLVEAIVDKDPTKSLDITQKIIDEGKNTINLLWEMIKYVRNLMLFKATKQASNVYNENEVKKITELSEKVDKERLLNIVFELSKLENDLRYSSQKNIVFQVGILKLSSEDEETVVVKKTKTVVEAEPKVEARHAARPAVESAPRVEARPAAPKVENITKPETITAPVKGEAPFWSKIIQQLREEQMPAVASALTGTHGFVVDDLTFGISGVDAFKKMIIEKPENISAIKRLVSIECKKDMRIQFIDQPKADTTKKDEGSAALDLGIDINVID
jgi:DNA polymerase-3 subunit gamma/tau